MPPTRKAVHRIEFTANPIQHAFIHSRADADLFASRRGEGKSTAGAWACLNHTRINPGAKWAFIRDTWENLRRSTQETFFSWFPPGVFGNYHVTNKEWTWAEGVAKGTVLFMGMDDPKDASALLSLQLGGVFMDEPAPSNTSGGIDESIFSLAISSLRQPDMAWHPIKLAENNPDESHWTYRRFVDPGMKGLNPSTGKPYDYRLWQPLEAENVNNLPAGYYERMRAEFEAAGRSDLARRFVDGKFGFQSEGRAVTPQWSDDLHLALGLSPLPRVPVQMLWDWGHNPTCIITQVTPAGQWLILDAMVGDGIGAEELIVDAVGPLWRDRYQSLRPEITHIGDPTGTTGEQTSIARTPIAVVRQHFAGPWRPGPVRWDHRREPIQAILTRAISGQGLVRVDKHRAKAVHYALRGGWHYPVGHTGLIGSIPRKNIHSHPGDAMAYGAAILFPSGLMGRQRTFEDRQHPPSYFGTPNWDQPPEDDMRRAMDRMFAPDGPESPRAF